MAFTGNQVARDRPRYRGRWSRVLRAALLLLFFSGFLAPDDRAQQGKPSEYRVKAVYLFNFGKFVQWPVASQPPPTLTSFPICVLGQDPFGSSLSDTIAGESIDGLRLVARQIDRVENAEDCRIVFVSSSEENRVINILDGLQAKPVLTVSDMPEFCNRGGMIQFVLDGNKVRFQVNLTAAQKAHLTLSSQLLKVATSVQKNP